MNRRIKDFDCVLRNHPLKNELKILGHKAIGVLKDGKLLELSLEYQYISGEYVMIMAKIMDKNKGVITSNLFEFNDYLKTRTDNRKDYGHNGNWRFYLTAHSGNLDWYIAQPSNEELHLMMDAILEWANLYV